MSTVVAKPQQTTSSPSTRSLRLLSRETQIALDLLVLASALLLAVLLRFDFTIPDGERQHLLVHLSFAVLVQWAALRAFGAFDTVWRYVGMTEARVFSRAAIAATAILLACRLLLPDVLAPLRIPISIILMDAVLAFGGVVALRVVRRAHWEAHERRRHSPGAEFTKHEAVLLIGAGAAGVMSVRELRSRADHSLEVRGFIDDDPNKKGAVIAGVRVLGTAEDLPRLVPALGIDQVIVTIIDAPRPAIRKIVELCERIPVRVRTIPSLHDVLRGRVAPSAFADLRYEDLLGRDAVALEEQEVQAFLAGKVVMVTGAGGSIGSELARQVARFGPRQLLLVERAEFALFDIDRELREKWPSTDIVPLVGDIGDRPRMEEIFRRYKPQVVTHAAAHKHVPLMEQNPGEAVKNNVFGTLTLGEVAGESGCEAFVMISTDKAVNPTSVMGATKRIGELVIQDLGRRFATRYVAVRFGNVLGSAGSVIPIFRQQIAGGGPVKVTHPDMKRYFMTIPEAAVLVLHAGAMGEGGEIFILDMGEPVAIVDLARRMIQMAGYDPDREIAIEFTGVRPGEKLFEELETSGEGIAKTRHPRIFIGRIAGMEGVQLAKLLSELRDQRGPIDPDAWPAAIWPGRPSLS